MSYHMVPTKLPNLKCRKNTDAGSSRCLTQWHENGLFLWSPIVQLLPGSSVVSTLESIMVGI
jgi:hypothetical protein